MFKLRHFIFFIIISSGQLVLFGQTSVIQKLYSDTIGYDKAFNQVLLDYILKYKKDTLVFSLVKYTKVIAYRVNEPYLTGKGSYETCETNSIVNRTTKTLSPMTNKKGKTLTEKQIKILKSVYTNPDNFKWSECGTPILQAGFVFYNENEIIGFINIACDYTQTNCSPIVLQTKWGALSTSGSKELIKLCKQLGIYYGGHSE